MQDPVAAVDSDVKPAVPDDAAGQDSDENTIIYDYHNDVDSDNGTNARDLADWQCVGADYQVPNDIVFTGSHGIMDSYGLSPESKQSDIFLSLVTPHIIQLMADETNRYAR